MKIIVGILTLLLTFSAVVNYNLYTNRRSLNDSGDQINRYYQDSIGITCFSKFDVPDLWCERSKIKEEKKHVGKSENNKERNTL